MENQVDHNAVLRVGLDLVVMGGEGRRDTTIHHTMEKRARIRIQRNVASASLAHSTLGGGRGLPHHTPYCQALTTRCQLQCKHPSVGRV